MFDVEITQAVNGNGFGFTARKMVRLPFAPFIGLHIEMLDKPVEFVMYWLDPGLFKVRMGGLRACYGTREEEKKSWEDQGWLIRGN